jgi:hypothetical protein
MTQMSMKTEAGLKARIAELEEELQEMRQETTAIQPEFLLLASRQQAALLTAIVKRPLATYAYLDYVTEAHGLYNRYEGAMHQSLRTRVAVWKLRRALAKHNITIGLRRGVGYYMDDANKAKLQKLQRKYHDQF